MSDTIRYNQVLWLAENDVIVFSPLRSAAGEVNAIYARGDHNFILVFNSNITSTVHCFRYTLVLFSAGNDVTILSLPGSTASC